ncbi:hypothetical protein GZ77_10390 [Endozoicomonas montiporae]|uniref:Uncharacterized protein n=1 Tax=Endozoicomonas montiporae TaxID=1027273 RepID=A0A081N8D6_9GAMM|nr:hypothetical protein [Endozoicomonas montiporae]KEQ14709.1 hypothetical protein GZ77_10390 [Endozoicomonas montiporae]
MGRRRLLQKKLDLSRESAGEPCSSAWFRVEGKIDVCDIVGKEHTGWHERVSGNHPEDPDYNRFNSTNHFMGDGYWVWLIPLSTGYTSVGIVALEERQPFSSYNTLKKSMAWLNDNEPDIAKLLEGKEVVAQFCDSSPVC